MSFGKDLGGCYLFFIFIPLLILLTIKIKQKYHGAYGGEEILYTCGEIGR